jgi:probable HAF family extracellular repeat protein
MRRRFRRSVLAVVAMTLSTLSLCSLSNVLHAQTMYTLTNLGFLDGGTASRAFAINNDGVVTGASYSSLGNQAFIWDSVNGMRGIGFLPDTTSSASWAINIHQQIVGTATNHSLGILKSFIWDAVHGMQDIGRLPPHNAVAEAAGMNDSGQVVGKGDIAFVWDSRNGMRRIPSTLGGFYSSASDINEFGQVAGTAGTPLPTDYHAYIWDEVHGMRDLGTLPGGEMSFATALNNFGVVTGGSRVQGSPHAFRWDSIHGMQDLGALNLNLDGGISKGNDINNAGLVVGSSVTPQSEAFVWTPEYGMLNLNEYLVNGDGWLITCAYEINDRGQIVCEGLYGDIPYAILLNPVLARISGTIALDGITPTASAQPLTLTFRPADNSGDIVKTVPINPDGAFAVPELPRSLYTLHIKGEKWLAKNVEVDARNGDVISVNVTLPGGDANNDNVVDVFDLDLLVQAFNSMEGDSDWNEGVADFNGDGWVDVFDLHLLVMNFNAEGDA